MSKSERGLHFILRYSDNLREVDTFAEHKQIERNLGAVWWGKFGTGAGASIVATARRQLEDGTPTYVYLASNRTILYRGRLADVLGGGRLGRYHPEESTLVPSYYRGERLALWFKLQGLRRATRRQKQQLVLYNDPSSPPQLSGMNGLIYVSHSRSTRSSKVTGSVGNEPTSSVPD